jgi:Zinc carboxypeptidase
LSPRPFNLPTPSGPTVQSGINRAVLALLGFNLLLLAVIGLVVLFNTIPTLAANFQATPRTNNISLIETVTATATRPTDTATFTPQPTSTHTLTPTATLTATRINTATASPTSTATAGPSPTMVPVLPIPEIIGRSVKGHPLEVYQFGTGPTQRMIIAGIHGGYEANTTQLGWALIKHLSSHPELVPGNVTLYILPVFNPDGLAFAEDENGRANANGVDLNRNWDADWQYTWAMEGCWQLTSVTGGKYPGSEPETQALMDFIETHPLDALISYHSAALGIFPGGKPLHPASVDLAEQVAAVSYYPYPPIDTGCVYTGQLIDWAAQENIAALDIELSTHGNIDWAINLAILDTFLNWQAP